MKFRHLQILNGRGWFGNGLDFKWDLKSRSPTIWKLTIVSTIWYLPFDIHYLFNISIGWDYFRRYLVFLPLETDLQKVQILNVSGFQMVSFLVPTVLDFASITYQFISQLQVVVEIVLGPGWVSHVTCVGDCSFNDSTGLAHCLHANNQVGQVVERVKHSEDVHAILDCQVTKSGMEMIVKFHMGNRWHI